MDLHCLGVYGMEDTIHVLAPSLRSSSGITDYRSSKPIQHQLHIALQEANG